MDGGMNQGDNKRIVVESTAIPNELMTILMHNDLRPAEARVLMALCRKTYGWHKPSDSVSLSQFQSLTGMSRQSVVDALQILQLVKWIRLVKKGDSRLACNEYAIDPTDSTSKLVKYIGLVQSRTKQLVKYSRHTKETITKERESTQTSQKPSPVPNRPVGERLQKRPLESLTDTDFQRLAQKYQITTDQVQAVLGKIDRRDKKKGRKQYSDYFAALEDWIVRDIEQGSLKPAKSFIQRAADENPDIADVLLAIEQESTASVGKGGSV
jgi:phage replication O-like protein O